MVRVCIIAIAVCLALYGLMAWLILRMPIGG